MPSSTNSKYGREQRRKRNLLAKELQRKRWRQRLKDKNYKKLKAKLIEEYDDDSHTD